jgi:hypothetical protein
VLTSLAVQEVCNNHSCVSMTGASAVGPMPGRSGMCGACCMAHNCSRPCQKGHWKQHKRVCIALAAAAAAHSGRAGASGSGSGGGGRSAAAAATN